MKNDVVRWPVLANYKKTSHTFANIKKGSCYLHPVNVTPSDKSSCDSYSSDRIVQSVRCDNISSICVVQKLIKPKNKLERSSTKTNWSSYLYQLLNNGCNKRWSRTCSQHLFHLCVVIFVCSLNVGFVKSTAVEREAAIPLDSEQYELYNAESGNRMASHYTHTWAVHIPQGDTSGKADMVAHEHGFLNLGKVSKELF